MTAAALNASPSLKVTPLRSLKVYSLASELTVQLSASHGTISPVAGSWSVSESAKLRFSERVSIQ